MGTEFYFGARVIISPIKNQPNETKKLTMEGSERGRIQLYRKWVLIIIAEY